MTDVANPNEPPISAIARRVRQARRILFVTGAGLSADSGLPTYRGVGGLYDHSEADTEEGVSIEVALSGPMFLERPAVTWRHLAQIEAACRGAVPNAGHVTIARLENDAEVVVLTQNVDGLHAAAGSRRVIDIHGDIHDLRCPQCSYRERVRDFSHLSIPPSCPQCSHVIRPDVVLFEEMLPEKKLLRLEAELSLGFDVAIAIGTSALFAYILHPFVRLKAEGAFTAEINPCDTELSGLVDVEVRDRAAPTLEKIWKAL